MILQPIHQGGFLWKMTRGEREGALLRLAADVGQLILVTRSVSEARSLAERLTLSGLPVRVATGSDQATPASELIDDGVTSLVATHDYILEHGPLNATVAVHTRIPRSPRRYLRRLSAIQSPVHITLVLPEDEKAAMALFPQLADIDLAGDNAESLDSVLDLTRSELPASVGSGRRRFPLVR